MLIKLIIVSIKACLKPAATVPSPIFPATIPVVNACIIEPVNNRSLLSLLIDKLLKSPTGVHKYIKHYYQC